MGIKDRSLTLDQFRDLIGIIKDPKTKIVAFSFFDIPRKVVIDED